METRTLLQQLDKADDDIAETTAMRAIKERNQIAIDELRAQWLQHPITYGLINNLEAVINRELGILQATGVLDQAKTKVLLNVRESIITGKELE